MIKWTEFRGGNAFAQVGMLGKLEIFSKGNDVKVRVFGIKLRQGADTIDSAKKLAEQFALELLENAIEELKGE